MRSGSRLEAGAAGAAVRGGGAAAGSSLLREAENGQICGVGQVRETHGSEGRSCGEGEAGYARVVLVGEREREESSDGRGRKKIAEEAAMVSVRFVPCSCS